MSTVPKTRSSMFFYRMNDDVKAKLQEMEEKTGDARWLIAERILEKALNIDTSKYVSIEDFLPKNANRAQIGKAKKGK